MRARLQPLRRRLKPSHPAAPTASLKRCPDTNLRDARASLTPSPRRLRPGVVAALGAHHHLAVSLGLGLDSNLAEAAIPPRIRRLVADSILIPDIARHGPADLVDFIQRLG